MPSVASRRRAQQRSPREWAVRAGIATVALALGYISSTQTLAIAVSAANVERAYSLNPNDGRIEARLAEQMAMRKGDAAQRIRIDRLAHQALLKEPLAVPALTALALDSQLRGNVVRVRSLFGYANKLSRRQLGVQLWLIEDAVGRGDVPGALRQYDIALRADKKAPELLFPILASAVSDPNIANELARVLVAQPSWSDPFVQYLGTSGSDPKSTAKLFRLLARRNVPVPEIAEANTVNNLITANAFKEAWDYYRTLREGVDPRRSRDPQFGTQIEIRTAFDWIPVMTDAGITASIQRTANGGVFEFAAPPTVGGTVLQQMQILSPGQYRIFGRTAGIEQMNGERPYWTLVCTDGRELGRVEVPNSSQGKGIFLGTFTVGEACPAQVLRLNVRPSTAVSGISGEVDRVELGPL